MMPVVSMTPRHSNVFLTVLAFAFAVATAIVLVAISKKHPTAIDFATDDSNDDSVKKHQT